VVLRHAPMTNVDLRGYSGVRLTFVILAHPSPSSDEASGRYEASGVNRTGNVFS
jgi:hypothetical protein